MIRFVYKKLLRTEIVNPLPARIRYTWGMAPKNQPLTLAPGETVVLDWDVFTMADELGRQTLCEDIKHGRVKMRYLTDGVDCVRQDGAEAAPAPAAPKAVETPKATPSDEAAAKAPAPVPLDDVKPGPAANAKLAASYDDIGRTGSIESAKPEKVSPMDDAPVTRDAMDRISLDDWDGSLSAESERSKAANAQPASEIPEEAREVAAYRQDRQDRKEGRRHDGKSARR